MPFGPFGAGRPLRPASRIATLAAEGGTRSCEPMLVQAASPRGSGFAGG